MWGSASEHPTAGDDRRVGAALATDEELAELQLVLIEPPLDAHPTR